MGIDTPPLVLMRGPARSSFISNWCEAASEIADTRLLVTSRAEWSDATFRNLIRMRAALPNSARSRSNLLTATEARWLAATLKQKCGRLPDIVHTHFYADAKLATAFARAHSVPHVHTEHSSALLDPASISPRGLKLLRSTYNSATVITTVSQAVADAIQRLVPHPRVEVVPNPVIVPDSIRLGRTREPPEPGRQVAIVSVGGLIPLKRPMLALSAMEYLLNHLRFNAQLSFIGDGPLRAALGEASRKAGLTDRIQFHGQLDHKTTLERIAKADLLLHCSERETFGVALAEAAGCGVPVLTTTFGGVAERLGKESGFVVVDTDSGQRLALAIVHLMDSRPDTAELRRTAERDYSTHAVAERLRLIYGQLVQTE